MRWPAQDKGPREVNQRGNDDHLMRKHCRRIGLNGVRGAGPKFVSDGEKGFGFVYHKCLFGCDVSPVLISRKIRDFIGRCSGSWPGEWSTRGKGQERASQRNQSTWMSSLLSSILAILYLAVSPPCYLIPPPPATFWWRGTVLGRYSRPEHARSPHMKGDCHPAQLKGNLGELSVLQLRAAYIVS